MNTRTNRRHWSFLTLGALSACAFILAACGEQAGTDQGAAESTEQSSESTTTTQ